MPGEQDMLAWAVVMDRENDNVAVAKRPIARGARLAFKGGWLLAAEGVAPGHRLALCNIAAGEPLIQYGQPWAISRGIAQGQAITAERIEDRLPMERAIPARSAIHAPASIAASEQLPRVFRGLRRPGGRVGTRNYILVLPVSLCAGETARQLAAGFDTDTVLAAYPHVDGVVAAPHGEGCAVRGGITEEVALRALAGHIAHPNVGAVVVIDQGCENLPVAVVRDFLWQEYGDVGKPVKWLSIQALGGVGRTLQRGREILAQLLPVANAVERSECSVSELVLGTECGGSDAFSGITANPVLGYVADQVVALGGSVLLSEIPEIIGAEQLLMARAATPQVADDIARLVQWYTAAGRAIGIELTANPSLGNKAGGLLNIFIKSLGAVSKGGTAAVTKVIDYAEYAGEKGLLLMQGPGNDLESVTGLVAAGATLVGFTTGRGSVTGSVVTPVVKIASHSDLYRRMPEDMDFNAGVILDDNLAFADAGARLYRLMIEVASGEIQTASERWKQRQFQIWRASNIAM